MEVELQGEGPTQVVGYRLKLYVGFEAGECCEDRFQGVEVGLHEGCDAWVLDLDGDLAAVREACAGYLRYGGRGERLGVEIGRASCRGRVEISVVAVSLKKITP